MRNTRNRTFAIVGVFALISLLAWVAVREGSAAEPIKVGSTCELTGAQLVHATQLLKGIKTYIHKVNKEGGVLGRQVELVSLDDKSTPSEAVKNARDLIHTHKVDVIIQGMNSASSLGVSEVCRTAQVPVFINGTTEIATKDKGHRYVFRAIESSASPSYFGAKYINKHYPDKKKIYLIASDFEWGRRVSGDFWKYTQRFNPNATLVGESYVKIAETDYSPYIAKIKGVKPEVLFLGLTVTTPFLKLAKPVGLFRELAAISPGWNINEIVMLPKEDSPDGIVWGGTVYYAVDNPENRAFVQLTRELYNEYPYSMHYAGYMSAMFALEGMKKAGSTDKEKLVNALEGMMLSTPVGKVTLRDFDHQSTYPSFLGRVEWSDKNGYPMLENLDMFSTDEILPTKADVEAARKKTQ
jgi:branched-chain amino acid transport system substrate-binding protein